MGTSLEILGKPVKVVGTNLVLSQGDFHDLLAERGVTSEVREVVQKATGEIAEATLKTIQGFLPEADKINKAAIAEAEKAVAAGKASTAQKNLAANKPDPVITARLGSGAGRMTVAVETHKIHNGTNPQTGKPITTEKFGTVRLTVDQPVPKVLLAEDGIVASIRKACEQRFGK